MTSIVSPTDSPQHEPNDNYFQGQIPQINFERANSIKRTTRSTLGDIQVTGHHKTPSLGKTSIDDSLKHSPQRMTFAKSPVSPTSKFPFTSLPNGIKSIDANHLPHLVDEHIVIFDVRPFNLYSQSRVKTAVNLCMPSTLLRRPNYDLVQILKSANMDPEINSTVLSHIEKSPRDKMKVLVYDADSHEGHIGFSLFHTLAKFTKCTKDGDCLFDISYLEGGFNSLLENWTGSSIVETLELSPAIPSTAAFSPPSSGSFLSTSTGSGSPISPIHPSSSFSSLKSADDHAPFLAGFTIPSAAPAHQKFISNIKKNNLPKLNIENITKQTAGSVPESEDDESLEGYHYQLKIPEKARQNVDKLPKWLKFLAKNDNDYILKKLNAKFNKIEQSEQFRLKLAINNNELSTTACQEHMPGVCSPNTLCPGCDEVNYKIPKGIEYGFKNRYNNIWPYEHSRVKLISSPSTKRKPKIDDDDDYFNANYIHFPKLSSSKYIATQNPLLSTFEDFWKTVWYNKIPVIVCLNNQLSMLSQTPKYFDDQYFASSKITISTETSVDEKYYIFRKIKLSKQNYDDVYVYHFEYKDWPDFGVPSLFESILALINAKNDVIQSNGLSRNIIVHCSAGCGRTGCFITSDMILDCFNHNLQSHECFDPWEKDDIIYRSIQFQRRQRISMVQNLDQFIVCYEIILHYVVNNLV